MTDRTDPAGVSDAGPRPDIVIQQAVSHWFAQGGEAQFGAFEREPTNADELISEILSRVRAKP